MSVAEQHTSLEGILSDWAAPSADAIDVIIVDDDDDLRRALESLLESEGIATRSYASGQDFLAAYDPARGGCLILAAQLPDLPGLEVQRQIAAKNANLPVILIAGQSNATMVRTAFKAGVFDYIEKPYENAEILESVLDALARSRRIGGQAAMARAYLNRVERLTRRERGVFQLLLSGRPNKMIARQLGISHRTVEVHRARIINKMQAENLVQIMRMAAAAGCDDLWNEAEL